MQEKFEHNWQYVMSISPFIKEEEVESITELSPWDLLITFYDGRKIRVDKYTGCHQNVFYEDIKDLTEQQERIYFAYRLRSLMGRKGLGQEEFAELLGTSQVMISRYITGKVAPSVFTVRKMAKILDCSIDDIFYQNY